MPSSAWGVPVHASTCAEHPAPGVQQRVDVGWRVPEFPLDRARGADFFAQIHENLAAVEACGFASAWVADHFMPAAEWQAIGTDSIECWTTIAYLAGVFPNLAWGSIVACQSYRNPALLAKMVANLCALAPGRIVLGIGAGWREREYRAYGYRFPPASARIRQLEESIEIARRLWTVPGPTTYRGNFYQIHEAHLQPKPDPLPAVMIGGGGERLTLRVVAKHADWYNLPACSLDAYRRKLAVLERHCAAVGRAFGTIRKTWACECVALAASRAAAERIAAASPFFDPESAVVGTPDDVAASLSRWVAAGVTHFQLRFADFPGIAGVRLFAEEVLPRLRGS